MKAAFLLTEDRVQLVLSPQTKTETAVLDLLHDGEDKVVEAHRANFVERRGYSDFPPLRDVYGVVEPPKDTLLVVSRRTPEPVAPASDPRLEGLYEQVRAAMEEVEVRCYDPGFATSGVMNSKSLEVAKCLKSDLLFAALQVLSDRGITS